MKKLLLASVAAAALCSAPVLAADMPAKAAPVAPVAFDWSGWYVGIDAGGSWGSVGLQNPASGGAPFTVIKSKQDAGIVSVHGGVQHQWGQIVLGVEGGYQNLLNSDGSLQVCDTVPGDLATPIVTPAPNCRGQIRDMWTVGARAGWAAGNWMPYVTGGYANALVQMTTLTSTSASGIESASERQGGAYLGGGLDWLIMKNVVLGIEYRHYDFGHRTTYSQAQGACGGAGVGIDANHCELINFNPKADTISARLSFFFNPPLR